MIEHILKSFNLNPDSGFFMVNAEALAHLHVPPFPPTVNAVILQVADSQHLYDVLVNNYPEDSTISVLQGNQVSTISLERLPAQNDLQAVYMPASDKASFAEDFQEVVAHLRSPDGCPWDRKQTHDSLRTFFLEEVYELLDALDEKNYQEAAEELGDVMLQIFLHAQVAVEAHEFRLVDVFTAISSKMKRRHPHVFSTVDVHGDVDKVLTNWQEIKAQEREENGHEKKKGALDGVSKGLPALLQAQHYQQRAILNGFHWDSEEGAFEKVREEIDEVLDADNQQALSEKYGDLLFSLVSVISYAGFEAEVVLREANRKFYQRFTRLERALEQENRKLNEMTEAEKIALWESIKE